MNKQLSPIHPGKILMEEFLAPMGIRQVRFGKGHKRAPKTHQ